MTELTWPYRVTALAAGAVGVFLLLGSSGHLLATWPMVQETFPADLVLLFPGIFLLGVGLFNLAATRGLWKGSRPLYSAALALNGVFLAYLIFLYLSGMPDHPLGTFILTIGIYCGMLAGVRLSGRPPEGHPA